MAELLYNQNPTISDTIVFPLETPGADGCFTDFPYKVNNLTIYYVERGFNAPNQSAYNEKTYVPSQLLAANASEAIACGEITPQNVANAGLAKGNPITDISATSPAVVTSAGHGLTTGDKVFLLRTNSKPSADGEYEVTVTSNDTFSVPLDLSGCVFGTFGNWYPSSYISDHAKNTRARAEGNSSSSPFYFDMANPVKVVGGAEYPAWITGHAVTAISKSSPTVVTSPTHGLSTGDTIYLYGSNCVPPIDGEYQVTFVDANSFSVPVDLSGGVAGNKGFWYTAEENTANRLDLVVVNGRTSVGNFRYVWQPNGVREGDFFACWTWTPEPGGETLSSHVKFTVGGDTAVTTVVPSHFTDPKKYTTLFERYTPQMLKEYISSGDVSPQVFDNFNSSLAMGFTQLENLANQIVDLQNPNVLAEPLIPYLANLFNLKLKTADPARWRGQVVRAVQLNKKKGTRRSVEEALSLAGMRLNGLYQLYQVISKYTWQESFAYSGSLDFTLRKEAVLPIDVNNFDLWIRMAHDIIGISASNPARITSPGHGLSTGDVVYIRGSDSYPTVDGRHSVTVIDADTFSVPVNLRNMTAGTSGRWYPDAYTQLDQSYVSFSTVDGVTTMSWVGSTLLVNPITLYDGDIVRVLYQYDVPPDMTAQLIEDYVRTLPLIDTRDELAQVFPLKNWNVRGIREDDALFNVIVPDRNPFHPFINFGKIRTEFPYSENIYNMDEYNGSVRDSKAPCDIGREFLDPCSGGISSSYNIDVEIYDLSNDRIREMLEVLSETVPFHAVLHTANIYGGFQDFVVSPLEQVSLYITYYLQQFAIAGDAQRYFTRTMRLSNLNDLPNTNCILRDALAAATTPVTGLAAVAYNTDIVLYCPGQSLETLGIQNDASTQLEILTGPYASPVPYPILQASGSMVRFNSAPAEPISECPSVFDVDGTLNPCAFSFRIYQPVIDAFLPAFVGTPGGLCNIDQDNVVFVGDPAVDLGAYGVKSQFDVDNGTALTAFTVVIPPAEFSTPGYPGGTYLILNVDPNGQLLLDDPSSSIPLGSFSGVDFAVYDGATAVFSSTTGTASISGRGRVTVLNGDLLPIGNLVNQNGYYLKLGSNQYPITETVSGTDDQFYVGDYTIGSLAGANLIVNRWLVASQQGYMSHRGLNLYVAGTDLESSLKIQNGANELTPPGGDPIDPAGASSYPPDPGQSVWSYKENFIVEIGGELYWIESIDGDGSNTTIALSGNDVYWKTLANGGTAVTVDIHKYIQNGATIMGQQFDLPSHTFRTIDRSGGPVFTGTNEDGSKLVSLASAKPDQFHESIKHGEGVSFTIEYTNGSKEEGEL